MNRNDQNSDHGNHAIHDLKQTMRAGRSDVADEVRAAAGDVRSAAAVTADAAREAGASVGRHARAAAGSVRTALGDGAETAGDAAHDFVARQRDTLLYWQLRVEDFVQTKPMPALAAAAGVGLIVGLWLRGSRR